MNIPDDLDKWFDDWKVGDLALCVSDRWVIDDRYVPENAPKMGEVYTVSEVYMKHFMMDNVNFYAALLRLEGRPGYGVWNKMFKKLPPITETIKDAAKRGAYSKTPVTA